MKTNFDFLLKEKKFRSFASIAVSAEKILFIDPGACAVNCRRAMEAAVKWMYSVDADLVLPYQDKLSTLMNTIEFRDIMDNDIWERMDFIRKVGNSAAHSSKKITLDEAKLCLEDLWYFMDFVAYCYADDYQQGSFDKSLLVEHPEEPIVQTKDTDVDIQKLIDENKSLKEQLSARREEKQKTYVPNPLDLSEYETRKIYIDASLTDIGWIEHKDWIDEYEVDGMPTKTGKGYVDYVLFGDDGRPLGIIEAKKTCVDLSVGRQQAKLYADCLERKFGRRPIIFLSNGFEYRIDDGQYPERKVSSVYSKRDLEKLFNLRKERTSLSNIHVNKSIAGRYYQEAAIKAVCEAFDQENRRKALLVMATGSGKTRTVIGLVDVLLQHGWIKNILFLADRNALVTQAKRNFTNLLPNLSNTNLGEDKTNYNAHCVFSTYPTMMNCIDDAADQNGRLFTSGHFDLVICDEAHRSIYNKYQDIFNYFDAPLVGLTATPKDEIDKNTYEIFDLEDGVPTYGYELAQAVEDHYLVPYVSVESPLKFVMEGIHYDDLTEKEKQAYEDTFGNANGAIPDSINANALNSYVFNKDTIVKVIDLLWRKGQRIDEGEKLGKTIIFAKNHKHAEAILDVFNHQHPELPGYAQIIDNQVKYSQTLIDSFSDPDKLPQIAISVDMMDTGVDVPKILNLVFFKRVLSKAKFWQMIGRGTRLCPGLIDGKDKENFYIFDVCGNFEFFRMGEGVEVPNTIALQGALYVVKAQICSKLQDTELQTDDLVAMRKRLVSEITEKVKELNRDNFAVKMHMKYVDLYSNESAYDNITYEDTLLLQDEIAPLLQPDKGDPKAFHFDYIIYEMEYKYLQGEKYGRIEREVERKVSALSKLGSIPEVSKQKDLINTIEHGDFFDAAGIMDMEKVRLSLRDLMKYIQGQKYYYLTDFKDEFLNSGEHPATFDEELPDYRKKAEYYIKQHEDDTPAIHKLKNNEPLTNDDIHSLEKVLWKDLGSKEDYEKEYGNEPLGEFVRHIVGLNMDAAKKAFSDYLDHNNLNTKQIYFVNQIIEYLVQNGTMTDFRVMQDAPFTDNGGVTEVFTDLNQWADIRKIIDQINANANVS